MKEIQDCIHVLNRFQAAHHYVCNHTGNTHRISAVNHNIFTWTNALQSFQIPARRNPHHWTSANLAWAIAIMQNITIGLHAARIELLAEWLCNSQQQIHQPRRRQQLELSLDDMDTEVEQLPCIIIPSLNRAMTFAFMREDSLRVMSSSLPATGAQVNLMDNNESAAGPVRPTGKKYKGPPVATGGAYNITNSYIQILDEFHHLLGQVRSQYQSIINAIKPNYLNQIAAKTDPSPVIIDGLIKLRCFLPQIKHDAERRKSAQYRSTCSRDGTLEIMKRTNSFLRRHVRALRAVICGRRNTSHLGPTVDLLAPLKKLSGCYLGLYAANNSSRAKKTAAAASATH